LPAWGFLSYHALVLVFIAQNPGGTVREMAQAIGMTERATLTLLRDLKHERIITSKRTGRRNVYAIDFDTLARHRPWTASAAPVPDSFIDVAVRTLKQIAVEHASAG
jgi:DNA-binding IclR family transcriptional regulator